uniref:Peroxisomal ATPase PEX1 n=1 Tax=Elaeophora elaphi TaxID=1147741 RepID=A0A0R3RUG1_9BILA
METYSAVLKYHQRRNCFGYIQQRYSDIARTTSIQVDATSSAAYNIIRCENSTTSGIIQVFAPSDHCCYRPKILLINKIFADLFGLCENEEVIIQKIETAPLCSSFEVQLASAEDWNVVVCFIVKKKQNSAQRIEELLLKQIQLITVGQTYPVWIAQNLYIYFTVARIEAFSSLMQNAWLCEFTEVHVKPFNSSSSSFEKTSSRDVLGVLPASFACRMKNLLSDLSSMPFVFRIQDYCGNVLNRTVSRVLPEILINDVSLEELDVLAVFRLNFSQSNSEIVTISTVCNSETGRIAHALLIELPIACSRFAALRDCLKRYDSHHCAFSHGLYQYMNGEYEWIKVSPLPRDHIHQLGTLEILSEGKLPDNFNECLRNHLWKTHRHYPIVVPFDGLKVEMNLTHRARIQCRIRPHLGGKKEDSSRKCFVFTNDVFPTLEYSTNENTEFIKDGFMQLQETNTNEDIQKAVINFGGWKNEAVEFSFQSALIEKCYMCITYHLENPTFSSSENVFIVGNKSTGKTTILHLLAEKLLNSHLVVYRKSTERFQDVLKAAMTRLIRRYPSILFLDNLDFLLHGQDEDVRNVRLEKCAELVRNLVTENNLLVVATACNKHEVIELFSLNAGGRFFGHVEGIAELNAVS